MRSRQRLCVITNDAGRRTGRQRNETGAVKRNRGNRGDGTLRTVGKGLR